MTTNDSPTQGLEPVSFESALSLFDDFRGDRYFEAHPFRLLELPCDADRRLVDRRIREVQTALASAGVVPDGSCRWLPLASRWDAAALSEVRNRLADPRRRFVDELFWFWTAADTIPRLPSVPGDEAFRKTLAVFIATEVTGD
jgi:hypothetical protein